jgi:hypothetical protein
VREASIRRRKFSSMLPASGTAPGRPNPPASSAAVSPPGQLQQRQGVAWSNDQNLWMALGEVT